MVEIVLPIPKLDEAKVTQIAQSDKWTAVTRLASLFAAAVTTLLLAPLVIWGFSTIQASSVILATHSGDIANVQTTVNAIKAQTSTDHDNLIILGTRFDNLVTSNTLLKAARDKQVDGIMDAIKQLWRRDTPPKDATP